MYFIKLNDDDKNISRMIKNELNNLTMNCKFGVKKQKIKNENYVRIEIKQWDKVNDLGHLIRHLYQYYGEVYTLFETTMIGDDKVIDNYLVRIDDLYK